MLPMKGFSFMSEVIAANKTAGEKTLTIYYEYIIRGLN